MLFLENERDDECSKTGSSQLGSPCWACTLVETFLFGHLYFEWGSGSFLRCVTNTSAEGTATPGTDNFEVEAVLQRNRKRMVSASKMKERVEREGIKIINLHNVQCKPQVDATLAEWVSSFAMRNKLIIVVRVQHTRIWVSEVILHCINIL